MTRTSGEMTERSQHQIPPTAHTQKRKRKQRIESRPTGQQSANHNATTETRHNTRLLNCVISYTARLCSSPQQMLLSAAHWPRDISEK
ncbi:hypothetical protein PoB_004085700 [Plakobranchus ocellatus]|uniref:Uncharacterized protein n=1 Tax=Plakobranchus ocellatus TaxID=259542 RepID=A0AAV4B592_9GAST|nr:hypothetical protein PoB_004085700 [Plakobranchus ocellatus]